jgi:hypothetical protein
MNIKRNDWLMNRRRFLAGAGAALGLPWLEAMSPRSKNIAFAGELGPDEVPRRAMFTYWGLGLEIRQFTPKTAGRDYELSPTLQPLAPYKDECTVMTGLTSYTGGHGSCCCMLTGLNTVRNGQTLVSVDQQIAAFHGNATRHPSLVLGMVRDTGFGSPTPMTLSWSRNRTPMTPENRPEALFAKLFKAETPESRASAKSALTDRKSVMDAVLDQAKSLEKRVGKDDRARLEQYFTAVRDVEDRIKVEGDWIDRPKPKVDEPAFASGSARDRIGGDGKGYSEYTRLMFDLIVLAFQTDSTRVVTHIPRTEGDEARCYGFETKARWDLHSLTHHDEDEEKLAFWRKIDPMYMAEWAYFLGKLKSVKEGDGTLLDHTMASWATTNGGFGAHDSNRLPLILCGGRKLGLTHQGHLVKTGTSLADVWQTVVGRIGMPLPENFQGGQAKGEIKELL